MQGRGWDDPCFGLVLRGAGHAFRGAMGHGGGGRGRVARCSVRKRAEREGRRERAGDETVYCARAGVVDECRNVLLGDGSARDRQRARFVRQGEVEARHGTVRREVGGDLWCSGAGDWAIFGWDVHLRSVGDERRRQDGHGALGCLIPKLVWAAVHAGQGTEGQRNAGRESDRWAQDEQGEQGAWCKRHFVRITGLLSTGRAWRC